MKAYIAAGSRGIGLEIARRLLRGGADVAFSGRNVGRLEAARKDLLRDHPDGRIITVRADIASIADQEHVAATLEREGFWPDVLVCSAGQPGLATLETVSRDQLQYGFEMLLAHAVFATQRFVRRMAEQGYGRLFFVSSIHAKYPNLLPFEYFISGIARAGLFALVKVIQEQYAGYGVGGFLLLCGYVDTPLLRNVALGKPADCDLSEAEALDGAWRTRYDEWSRSIPCNRIGSASDLAETVAFLCRPEAQYLTGTTIHYSGGLDHSII